MTFDFHRGDTDTDNTIDDAVFTLSRLCAKSFRILRVPTRTGLAEADTADHTIFATMAPRTRLNPREK